MQGNFKICVLIGQACECYLGFLAFFSVGVFPSLPLCNHVSWLALFVFWHPVEAFCFLRV